MQVQQNNVVYSNQVSAAQIDVHLPEGARGADGSTALWAQIAVDGPLSVEELRIIAAACLDSADWMTAMASPDPRQLEELTPRLHPGVMDEQYIARLTTVLGS